MSNGLSLCSLHHAAFDRYFIGLRPDYTVEVRGDLLAERDGPTLSHAIQGIHGKPIKLPRNRDHYPAHDGLTKRYERFLKQSV